MSQIHFLAGLHNHQPVGNFDHVFEESFDNCYKPQTEILKRHPGVRIALHHSGPLFEWIEKNRSEYIDTIAQMAEAGQIEIMSGGFYEPILSAIPEDDAIGQIVMMNEYIKKRFGQTPKGMWTAERIWDPAMPKIANQAGIRYTLLDDTHFYYAGLQAEDMFGYYVTEKHGATLAVFPIDKNLRYSIPFKWPSDNIAYLKSLVGKQGVTYGDDGEKFGVWPDTYKWVYEEKWLDNFYTELEKNSDTIKMTHFSEFIASHPSRGRIYLPQASYEEMMEWTLPAKAGAKFHSLMTEIEVLGKKEIYKPFMRGGLWSNFQTKYDESNRMLRKAIHVSDRLHGAKLKAKDRKNAQRELYKGECNCPYWHGLFGGLYLNYLRHAVYNRMIAAENIIDNALEKGNDWIRLEQLDYDADGLQEVVVQNKLISAVIDPDYGGSLLQLDYRRAEFSLSNTLTRRYEAYHEKIVNANTDLPVGDETPASIHDIVKMKEEGLADKLVYDKADRRSFQDHFLSSDITLNSFSKSDYEEAGDFLDGAYNLADNVTDEKSASVTLERDGVVISSSKKLPVTVSKTLRFTGGESTIVADYKVTNNSDRQLKVKFGIEFNMTLLAGDAKDRYFTGDTVKGKPLMNESGIHKGSRKIGIRDDWHRFEASLTSETPVEFWRFAVETVSQSESGFERTYQGSSVTMINDIDLAPGQSVDIPLTLAVVDTK